MKTAVITLTEFQKQLEEANSQLHLARAKAKVLDIMERGGLIEAIPAAHFYPSVQTAVDAYLAER